MNTDEYKNNPHKDSGFDVYTPKGDLRIAPGGTKLVDMKIQCAAYKIVCDENTCVRNQLLSLCILVLLFINRQCA